MQHRVFCWLAAVVLFLVAALNLSAQGNVISYQGQLNSSGSAANASYDFRFTVFDAPTNGNAISFTVTNLNVPVSNGLFSVALNFGPGVFNGTDNGTNDWLDIAVRTAGGTAFTPLVPRQPILPVPYALFALGTSNLLGNLQATQVVGTISSSLISGTYSNTVNFVNGTNTFAGTFSGNGAGLNNLNASSISSGTLADARLPADVALLGQNQTFTGVNSFTGSNSFSGLGSYTGVNNFTNNGNSFFGSFFGNGLVGWLPVYGPNTNAVRDTGYLLLNPALTTVTLPATASLTIGDIVRISGAGVGGWIVKTNSGQTIIGNFASYNNSFMLPTASGNNWQRICCSSDGSRMYASGILSANGVYSSADYGHTWSPTTIVGTGWFALACSGNGNTIYAAPNGSSSGAIQSSSNGGATFTASSVTGNWNAIACSADGSKLLAAPASGSLYVSTGSSPASGNWTAVACSGDGSTFVAALGTQVYSSINSGSSWRTSSTLPGTCYALAASSSGSKLVATYNGGYAISTNSGTTWTTSSAANMSACLAASSDCSRLVIGASSGLFAASANFGATWTSLTSTNQYWAGACMSADGTKIAATTATVGGATGGIYYSSTSVQPTTIGTYSAIYGSQGSAVELQYIGNNQFMPVGSTGVLWAN